MHSVTSNAVSEALNNMTIHKIWGELGDYGTSDVVLQGGFTYLFINTHVNATEFVLFSFYQGQITQVWRMTNNPITNIAGIDANTVRLSANGNCRGYIFKIGDTSGA